MNAHVEILANIPESGALALTIPETKALAFFAGDGAVDSVLAAIKAEIDKFSADVKTAKGRKEIASMAFKIAQSKSYLEGVGKELAAQQKEIPKKIDASRKHIRDTLDAWRDEVRAPLTAWEEAEAARVARHKQAIEKLEHAGREPSDCLAIHLRAALAVVQETIIGPHLEEFEAEYARAKDGAVARLTAAVAVAEKREAEQAELERLRKEAAEREERERIARIEREAADRARVEAERKAAEEIERREAAARAEREAIEARAKAEREESERREKESALRAERERLDAAARELELKRQAEEAQRKAAETEARVKREADEAKTREEEAAKRREEDREHRASINNAAKTALIAGGLDEEAATLAVTLIAKRLIPNVTISY
jgi:septal ring factor EnvC (AmiA/AmiB activator)